MILDAKVLRNNWLKKIVPILVVLGNGYIDFAVLYSLGYQEIYKYHSHGVAITLWVLFAFCQVTAIVYWILTAYVGPGKQPEFDPFNLYEVDNDQLTKVPEYFLCDEYGFPFYSSTTNSINVPRSFLSKDLGYLTLKFDHYCVWIGIVIGEGNHLLFMKLTIWIVSYLILSLIFLIRFTPQNVSRSGEINHNFIALYIVGGFWLVMISALTSVHLRYISTNMTTLEDITINQTKAYAAWKARNQGKRVKKAQMPRVEKGKRYVNMKDKDGIRVVVQFDVTETPYSLGFKKNWINFVYNGNRNHGLSEHVFTTQKLAKAISIMILPFIDIPVSMKGRRKASIDTEEDTQGVDLPTLKLAKYLSYSNVFSDKFIKRLNEKIERKDCYLPSYIRAVKSDTSLPLNPLQEKLGP